MRLIEHNIIFGGGFQLVSQHPRFLLRPIASVLVRILLGRQLIELDYASTSEVKDQDCRLSIIVSSKVL